MRSPFFLYFAPTTTCRSRGGHGFHIRTGALQLSSLIVGKAALPAHGPKGAKGGVGLSIGLGQATLEQLARSLLAPGGSTKEVARAISG